VFPYSSLQFLPELWYIFEISIQLAIRILALKFLLVGHHDRNEHVVQEESEHCHEPNEIERGHALAPLQGGVVEVLANVL